MQFYLNGYRPGDPSVENAHPSVTERKHGLPNQVDVLIIGCGPAGLLMAAQMANFPDITTAVVDRRDGPLQVGQADGVACRTVEIFQALGLADRLVQEGYWVNEVSFWQPDPEDRTRIKRAGRVRDTEDDLSEFPHVIVNQARMLAYLLEYMERSASRLRPIYGMQAVDVTVDRTGASEYPVTVTLRHMQAQQEIDRSSTVKAKYVVGCDGARSATRAAIGRELKGDLTNVTWGVMDVLATTDFPDIRVKSTILSANEGNMLIIPREGGYLTRFYIELDALDDREMARSKRMTPQELATVANRILYPYAIDVKDVGWWSVYEIGQRLCEKFDDVPAEQIDQRVPRVFIAGDACHTHSAKAGQGMNVSMADTWNLGWKLASVLKGTARPEILHTYTEERQKIAKELIDFDTEFSQMFSARPNAMNDADDEAVDPQEFQRYFVKQGRFTAGVATKYGSSMIIADARFQHLAVGFEVGMRFHSAPVIRFADGKPLQLGHVAGTDGAWRVYVFADQISPMDGGSRARALCEFLGSDASPVTRFTPDGADPDSVIDVRATFQQHRHDLALERMPTFLLPRKGRFGLIDYEKMFCADPDSGDIFEVRGVNREARCIVVVRPDQYVSHILPLDAHEALTDFLAQTLIEVASPPASSN